MPPGFRRRLGSGYSQVHLTRTIAASISGSATRTSSSYYHQLRTLYNGTTKTARSGAKTLLG